mgnify:CR=1 FL=1
MMGEVQFALDASVTVAWAFKEELNKYTRAVLRALREGKAYVPSIWPLEVGNALLVAERRGRLKHAEVEQFLTFLRELPITIERESPERLFGEIMALAREQRLSTYDATYLDLAMRLGLPLATQDRALRRAATRYGVEIFKRRRR